VFTVLQSWEEIGEAILGLQRLGLPLHLTPQKNWDHWLLCKALAQINKDSPLADLGCGEGHTLRLLKALGFEALEGVDFKISPMLRAGQVLSMYRTRTLHPPYHLRRADLHKTPLQGEAFDAVISISTIEHGVDVPRFFREAGRLLRRGGLLFITTDYWEDKIGTSNAGHAFGFPWKIFCRDEVVEIARAAEAADLQPVTNGEVPPCADRPVCWNNRAYTFIAMLFRKFDRTAISGSRTRALQHSQRGCPAQYY
jgi:SAM-dependent methyltransferase